MPGDFLGGIFGGGDNANAGARAAEDVAKAEVNNARIQSIFGERALGELRNNLTQVGQDLQPFIGAGGQSIGRASNAATPRGLAYRLAEIMGGDVFRELSADRMRAAQGQLAAGGLTRSGAALNDVAAIGPELALAIEDQLFGRDAGLANTGLSATNSLTNTRNFTAGNVANTTLGIGQVKGQAGVNAANARAPGILTDAQSEAQGNQNLLNTATTAAGIFFSDPALKVNAAPVGQVGDLTLYQWDWIPEAQETVVSDSMTLGFMADEVKQKYPQHVYPYCGFDVVDYANLIAELEKQCLH